MLANKNRTFLSIVVLVCFWFFWLVVTKYIPNALVLWDEAANLYWAKGIVDSLVNFDINSLSRSLRDQYYLPPFGSLVLTPAIFLGESSVYFTRVLNLIWTFLGVFMVYRLSLSLSTPSKSKAVAALAMAFYIFSPMVILHASIVLREAIGAFLTLVSIASYIWARSDKKNIRYILTGIFITLLTFTKYNYGFYVIAAIFIEFVYEWFFHKSKKVKWHDLTRSHFYLFIPVFITVLFWIIFQGSKITGYYFEQIEMTKDIGTFWDKVFFYPRSLVYLYSPSVVLGIIQLITFTLAFKKLHLFHFRFLLITILLNLIFVGGWFNNLHDRYIFTVVPLIYVVSAIETVDMWPKVFARVKKLPRFIVLLFFLCGVSVLGYDLLRLPIKVLGVGAVSLRSPVFSQVDYTDHWFNYRVKDWSHTLPKEEYSKPDEVFDFIFQNTDPTLAVELVGWSNELSPRYFRLLHERWKTSDISNSNKRYVAGLRILPFSRFWTRDFELTNKKELARIDTLEKDVNYKKLTSRLFSDLGIEVTIYKPL